MLIGAAITLAGPDQRTPGDEKTARKLPERCGDAREYKAFQFRGAVIVSASGVHPTSGFKTYLQQLPIDIYPPQFVLMHVAPSGIVSQVITPFRVSASFPAFDKVASVTVHDATGPRVVPVVQIKNNDNVDNLHFSELTVIAKCKSNPKLKNFTRLLEASDFATILGLEGPFTVFAPEDNGLIGMPVDEWLKPAHRVKLVTFLSNHIMAGRHPIDEIELPRSIDTLCGQVFVHPGKGLSVDGQNIANYVTTDDYCGNGIIQVLNRPLPPRPKR
jgi:uncharacterized surface protein with fasciclin (FAS1) repeats